MTQTMLYAMTAILGTLIGAVLGYRAGNYDGFERGLELGRSFLSQPAAPEPPSGTTGVAELQKARLGDGAVWDDIATFHGYPDDYEGCTTFVQAWDHFARAMAYPQPARFRCVPR